MTSKFETQPDRDAFYFGFSIGVIVGAFVVTVLFVARLCPYMAARCAQADEIYSAVCGEGLHDGR